MPVLPRVFSGAITPRRDGKAQAPLAPPVYRPAPIQLKPQAKPGAPPVYRPQPAVPRAVQPKMLQPGRGLPVQRFIAKDTTVYYPDTVAFPGSTSRPNFERALAALGGPPGQGNRGVRSISWSTFARDIAGYELTAMGSPTKGTNQKKVKRQFLDEAKVYYYRGNQNIQTDAAASTHLLLGMKDMKQGVGAALPTSHTHGSLSAAKCVIEILSAWNVAVPIDQGEDTVEAWHSYSRSLGLDYRQDNHYVVLYVQKLGYPLINSTWIAWNSWNPANGRYIASSASSDTEPNDDAVGHMIGITVAGGGKTILDIQQLSPGTGRNPANFGSFKLRYIFRVQ